ncbi:MAG TPA: T9SS type A sorting domain-containing protein, partial [Methylomirabilota bacterium]|nr:T9SS type A sorting domain-containing protein [Methylomirabilota bacterium]
FTWNVTTAHPVTAGVNLSFNVETTADLGTANSGTVLVTSGTGEPMVIVKPVGSGHVVHFSCAGNYNGYQPFLQPDMQRLFLNAADWLSGKSVLSASPTTGIVPAHGSLDLTVTADAGLLHAGTHPNSLLIATNDPAHPLLTVPASVTVTAAADIALAPDTLRFAGTLVGGSRVDTVQVSNPGSQMLHVTAVATTAPFSVPAVGFDLAPGAIRKLAVTFAPGAPGTFARSLLVSSDDPDEPTASVQLRGTGLAAGLRDEAAATGDPAPALSLALHGLVPNPPVHDLMVSFTLPDAEPATVELLDLAGRRLRLLQVGAAGPGRHSLSLGAVGSLRSGVYLVRLKHRGQSLVSKCVLMR